MFNEVLMIKKLVVILLISKCSLIYAQTIKTGVLVIGSGASGVAAAMQCARSKVKTILAVPDPSPGDFGNAGICSVDARYSIPSGIWCEFRNRVQAFYRKTPGFDTACNAPLNFEPNDAASILKKMTDTIKNLTVYFNATFTTIKKDGGLWEVTLAQNEKTIKIKARVVVDGTENGDAATKGSAQFAPAFDNEKDINSSKTYRTSIATGRAWPGQHYNDANAPKSSYPPYPAFCIPMHAVLVNNADNLLVTEKALAGNKDIQYLPVQMALGQGVGTVAAYCAFFKTTTKNLKVRIIQGELLDFKGYLLPFNDILQKDTDWRAIQQVCATGLLKGVQQAYGNSAHFLFKPDSLVSTAEIKPVLMEIYTRAFLWFGKERPGDKFTLGNLLSFISDYTLTDPLVLKSRIQRDWNTQYKFKNDFNLNRQVTRREFAVLANKFINPFARTVDLNGELVN